MRFKKQNEKKMCFFFLLLLFRHQTVWKKFQKIQTNDEKKTREKERKKKYEMVDTFKCNLVHGFPFSVDFSLLLFLFFAFFFLTLVRFFFSSLLLFIIFIHTTPRRRIRDHSFFFSFLHSFLLLYRLCVDSISFFWSRLKQN